LAVYFVTSSRVGLALKAIREDEVSAMSHGINVLKYKVIAFAGGAFMAGVAGSIYGYYLLQVTPINVLTFNWLFLPILMTVLGGTGTLLGPWLGAFVIYLISWYGGSYFAGWDAVISGVVIILVMIFIPSGIVGVAQKVPGLWRRGAVGP
jgi:branched-chain amino acid transport system permease protein